MAVGDIIGTHNGDVTAPVIRAGSTDSAWLFGQLDRAGSIKATASVLTGLRGRAALAWTRRSRPGLVYLARTALSPLSTAIDRGGALWWASNPQWLREIGNWHDLELSNPVQMREGTLIVLNSDLDEVGLVTHRRFTPTSRPRDERIAHTTAWRGFTTTDRRHELAHRSHHIQGTYRARWISSGTAQTSCRGGVQRPSSFHDPRVKVNDEGNAQSLSGGTLSRYPTPPPVGRVKTTGILAVLVTAATAIALTACTTAAPQNPGITSTSIPAVSTPAVAVTPTADPEAAASASAAGASNGSAAAKATAESSAAEQSTVEPSSQPVVTPTAVVNVAAANAAGVPMPGFTVVDDQGSNSPVDCSFGSPNPAAVGVNTHDCSPHAASAHFCWGTTGTVDLVCSWDPRSTELHRYTATEPLTDTAAAADPVPWGLDLADRRQCDVRLGGAFSGRPDDYTVAYVCDGAAETYVLGNSTDPVVDTSGPQWIVKVGELSHNPTVTSLPPPEPIGVVTAYFAATG
jgi:hypothetical protein